MAQRRRSTLDLERVEAPNGAESNGVRAEARRAAHQVKVAWLPIGELDETPAELNSRQSYDEASLNELAASIKELGILQPICVRTAGERYTVVFGNRRLKAAIRAGLKEIPCTIQVADDDRSFLLNTVENLHRQQISGSERVRAIERLAATNLGVRDIARRTGFNPTTISRWIRIDRHPAIKKALEDDSIALGAAMEISRARPESVPQLLRQVETTTEMPRSELRELVESSRTQQPTPRESAGRSYELGQHARAMLRLLEETSVASISASTKRDLDRLYLKLADLRA